MAVCLGWLCSLSSAPQRKSLTKRAEPLLAPWRVSTSTSTVTR
jgi:hypothetical protein